ncbi:glycosyltransferase family protein [Limimaricola pyoseonensis]|nr:glycosyltransferase [Limimaricola pyoseonensis]
MLDAVCVVDPRFAGGTGAAVAADLRGLLAAGRRVGLVEARSHYLDDGAGPRSRVIAELCADPRLERIAPGQPVEARVAFLHHPMSFFRGLERPVPLRAGRAFLVAHHLPFRGDGSLQYEPVTTARRCRRATGLVPHWLPVSGLCRRQLRSFAPLIRLAATDWPNLFDPEDWQPRRQPFSGADLVIGRHGRADPLKWPSGAAAIAASLPRLPGARIRVMGCPVEAFRAAGVDMTGWEILPFDAEPVASFAESLDVFVYHFHPDASESFGRTVAEAMLMGAVCVLDPRLEPSFGDIALYGPPEATAAHVARLRADPVAARRLAERARQAMLDRHGLQGLAPRFAALLSDAGEPGRAGPRHASPLSAARKALGMLRRGEMFTPGLTGRG